MSIPLRANADKRGPSWDQWDRSLDDADFTYLHDDLGNGKNLVALARCWFSFLGDSPIRDVKPYRVCSSFYARISSPYGLPVTIKEYAELGSALVKQVWVRDDRICYGPLFREFAKTPIFREYMSWVRTKDPRIFAYILSFLWFGKKARYTRGPELYAKSLENWLDVEEDLRKLQVPLFLTRDLRRLLVKSGFRYKREAGWPEHGPRQVAERLPELTTLQKNERLRLNVATREYYARLVYAHISKGRADIVDLLLPDISVNLRDANAPDYAQLAFVPKDYKSVRTICMEPLCNMYMQKAVVRAISEAIANSKLSRLIDISDQGKNRLAAVIGSLNGKLATIDLKDASDRNAWRLIRAIIQPAMLADLNDTRTNKVRILQSDIIFDVEKFAPMGAGYCFEMQCIVFALCVAMAHHLVRTGLDVNEYLRWGGSVKPDWPEVEAHTRVYGDDIICGEEYVSTVMILLERLGFKINRDKSFSGDQAVRESCGVYALNGEDVTPLTFKVKHLEYEGFESYLGLIALSNEAWDRGYYNLRRRVLTYVPAYAYVEVKDGSFYQNQASAVRGLPLPYKDDCVIEQHKRRYPGLDKVRGADRWNAQLHRWEREILTPETELQSYFGIDVEGSSAPVAQEGIAPIHRVLETYHYGLRLSRSPERKSKYGQRSTVTSVRSVRTADPIGKDRSPRDGIERAVHAGWLWTPVSE